MSEPLRVERDGAIARVMLTRAGAYNAPEGAMNMARELAKISLHSFGLSRQVLTDSSNNSLETRLERERNGLGRCGGHPDGQAGLKAFSEERKPAFI